MRVCVTFIIRYLAQLFRARLLGLVHCFVFRICNWVVRCIRGRAIYFRARKLAVVAEGGSFSSGVQAPHIGTPFGCGVELFRAEAGQWAGLGRRFLLPVLLLI